MNLSLVSCATLLASLLILAPRGFSSRTKDSVFVYGLEPAGTSKLVDLTLEVGDVLAAVPDSQLVCWVLGWRGLFSAQRSNEPSLSTARPRLC